MRDLEFDPFVLDSVVGGRSALDVPRLHFTSTEQTDEFLRGYGFDLKLASDLDRLWYFHRRALVFLDEKLGFKPEEIPEIIRERKQLQDPRRLLLWASREPEKQGRLEEAYDMSELQRWACAILRVMHVFVHAENDLFSSFSEEIQKQILTPVQDCIVHDGTSGKTLLKGLKSENVELVGFEVKPFKTSSSTVIKLLAKPSALALNVFDKLGFRFITHNLFDVFRVIRFLVNENIVAFPHIIPDQTVNSLYPKDLFLKVCEDILSGKDSSPDLANIELALKTEFAKFPSFPVSKKENQFSGEDYQFIKFISRKMILINSPAGRFSFFYPFEVQILDQKSYEKILSGPSEHQAYKERQRLAARDRVLGKAIN